jgi:hypothetical protein
VEKSSTPTTEDKIRELFAKLPKKWKGPALEGMKIRPQHADKLLYLKGWFYVPQRN